jgi:glycosyltransferase involved in cell wall biosynthesis
MDLLFAESSMNGWGTEQHFAALAIAMAGRGHTARCLISSGSPLESPLRAAGVPLILSEPFRGGTLSIRRTRHLHQLVREHRPDWVVTNDSRFYWPAIVTGRLTSVRTALFRHWPKPSGALTRRLQPWLADRFILVSEFQRDSFRREGVDAGGMQLLYNPIDMERFSPAEEARLRVRSDLGLSLETPVVGYVGRLVRDKGVYELLTASEQFLSAAPEARVLWVGEGAEMAELRAGVERSAHRGRHLFHPFTQDLKGIYNAIDVLVVPSMYPDPCPRVPVEAQACGTAVVCHNAGGLPETFQPDVSGTLVKAGDVAQLADAILTLVRDPVRRQAMGRAGRQFVCANFSFENIARNFEAVLADREYSHRIPRVAAAAQPGPG